MGVSFILPRLALTAAVFPAQTRTGVQDRAWDFHSPLKAFLAYCHYFLFFLPSLKQVPSPGSLLWLSSLGFPFCFFTGLLFWKEGMVKIHALSVLKLGLVFCACYPALGGGERRGSGVQSQPGLHGRPCVKRTIPRKRTVLSFPLSSKSSSSVLISELFTKWEWWTVCMTYVS